jgi:hypothetical protein
LCFALTLPPCAQRRACVALLKAMLCHLHHCKIAHSLMQGILLRLRTFVLRASRLPESFDDCMRRLMVVSVLVARVLLCVIC